jgi:hypothetical protein
MIKAVLYVLFGALLVYLALFMTPLFIGAIVLYGIGKFALGR